MKIKKILSIICCLCIYSFVYASFDAKIDNAYSKFTQKLSLQIGDIYKEKKIFHKLDIRIQKLLHKSDLTERKYKIFSYLQELNQKNIEKLSEATHFSLYPYYQNTYLKNISHTLKSKYFFKARTTEKKVALTFDDGPIANTRLLLDTFKDHNIPATFFVQCQSIHVNNKQIFDDELFTVGMHTYSHADYSKFSPTQIEQDMQKCIDVFSSLEIEAKYFRPAYGIITPTTSEFAAKNNIQNILWSIDSQDWNGFSGEKMTQHILDNLTSGSIILFHD